MTWKIQAINSELGGQDILIDRDMLVGRHQDANIVLQFGEISRRHAAFLLKDQALYLQDLNSSNGTFVNNIRIVEETLLQDGDTIAFATLPFVVMFEQTEVNMMAAAETTPVAAVADQPITQPSEAVACSAHLNDPQPAVVEQDVTPSAVAEPVVEAKVAVAEPVVEAKVVVAEPVVEAKVVVAEPVLEAKAEVAEPVVQADAEVVAPEPVPAQTSAAQQMSEQGMPDVAERAAGTELSKEGTPAHVAIPKPAPIPENRELAEKAAAESVQPHVEPQSAKPNLEEKKNASVGLITIIVLVILAVMAWLFLK